MAELLRPDLADIHFDVEGDPDGFPVLLIAPGGMRSHNELWNSMPWNPRTALADRYRLIGMDQRNAGRSWGPIAPDAGWATYAADQLAVLDQLGIERCHVIGMCIGGAYAIGLLRAAPERFAKAVLLQPVGSDDNRAAFYAMFDQWVGQIAERHPAMTDDDWRRFRSRMWDREFVYTATPGQVAKIEHPLLVMMGNDLYHPQQTSREIAAIAKHATLVERWKDDDLLPQTDATIKAFLSG